MKPATLALPLAALLALAACDTTGPLGGPGDLLPTRDELVAEFGAPAPGQAFVRETGDRPQSYRADASHFTDVTTGTGGTLRDFVVDLDGPESFISFSHRADGDTLASGDALTVGATYAGRGDGGRGSGRLYVTGREGDRIQGVFAADVNGSGLLPGEWRVTGAFDAALDPDGR
jgi:hypothetical protein